jgi:hypothetical protein
MLNRKITHLVPQPNLNGGASLWAICEGNIGDGIGDSE